ncbi:hypothetical protein AYI68_g6432 [Smittium mucronatum]|uniref:Uncharacterized protein n=1 Tax=Smittium mucronatum TaxID=133383 RepID=A0A1R0GRG4_9FUNG|nr:hypothetical protein AYI68_g6432 [Smittium mucronatum]
MSLATRGSGSLSLTKPSSELTLPSKASISNPSTSKPPAPKRPSSQDVFNPPKKRKSPVSQNIKKDIPDNNSLAPPKLTPASPEKDLWTDLEADLEAVLSDSNTAETPSNSTKNDSPPLIHRKSLADDSDDEDLFEEVLEPKATFSSNSQIILPSANTNSFNNSSPSTDTPFPGIDYADNQPSMSDLFEDDNDDFEEVIPDPISGSIHKTQSSPYRDATDNLEDSFSDLEKEMEESLI